MKWDDLKPEQVQALKEKHSSLLGLMIKKYIVTLTDEDFRRRVRKLAEMDDAR